MVSWISSQPIFPVNFVKFSSCACSFVHSQQVFITKVTIVMIDVNIGPSGVRASAVQTKWPLFSLQIITRLNRQYNQTEPEYNLPEPEYNLPEPEYNLPEPAADFDIVDQPAGFEKVDRSLISDFTLVQAKCKHIPDELWRWQETKCPLFS